MRGEKGKGKYKRLVLLVLNLKKVFVMGNWVLICSLFVSYNGIKEFGQRKKNVNLDFFFDNVYYVFLK